MYLPQFHPTPENDLWWGKGFTEWTNVVKARPLYERHYQPHLPADLGFYDLRLPEVREAQAELASSYGIHGFCFYHYWFGGRQILERPVNEIVATGRPDFPFCLCWANENWTRVWDGDERELLLQQGYSASDDLEHIRFLLPILADPRYIRYDDKPVFLVYRATQIPEPQRFTDTWRREAQRAGLPGIYLVRVESREDESRDPRGIGFDAAMEFQPRWSLLRDARIHRRRWWHRQRLGTAEPAFLHHSVHTYGGLVKNALSRELPSYPLIRSVCPGFDNTARKPSDGTILMDSTPERYGQWLSELRRRITASPRTDSAADEFLFINAWNEWAEGNHLEPCQRWGHAYLEATRAALR